MTENHNGTWQPETPVPTPDPSFGPQTAADYVLAHGPDAVAWFDAGDRGTDTLEALSAVVGAALQAAPSTEVDHLRREAQRCLREFQLEQELQGAPFDVQRAYVSLTDHDRQLVRRAVRHLHTHTGDHARIEALLAEETSR